MAKDENNLKSAEEFVRSVLSKNFGQTVDADRLRAAAEKLCDAIPHQRVAA